MENDVKLSSSEAQSQIEAILAQVELTDNDFEPGEITARTRTGSVHNTETGKDEITYAEASMEIELPSNLVAYIKHVGLDRFAVHAMDSVENKVENCLRELLKATIALTPTGEIIDYASIKLPVEGRNWTSLLDKAERKGRTKKETKIDVAKRQMALDYAGVILSALQEMSPELTAETMTDKLIAKYNEMSIKKTGYPCFIRGTNC